MEVDSTVVLSAASRPVLQPLTKVTSLTAERPIASDRAPTESRLLCVTTSSPDMTSKPAANCDSGVFTDQSMSSTEQSADRSASRSSSVLSVERSDSCIDVLSRPSSNSVDRPQSALARGVQIVDYPRWNPEPLSSANEESLVLMEEYLCPRKLVRLCADDLQALTGIDNLDDVQMLEMRVDTSETSLGNFGAHVPNLAKLKLSNSIVSCVRDLGSCLSNVHVLWMARCATMDLDGIASLSSLRELYLAYNDITDISPCSLLEHIQILDLEGNNIDDIVQIEFLSLCQQLTRLTFEGNPVCVAPNPTSADPDYDYRRSVKRALPQVEYLDDELLVEVERQPSRAASVFDADWQLIDELVKEGMVMNEEKLVNMPGRPTTAWPQTAAYRPGSALKPQSAYRPPSTGRSSCRGSTPDSGRPSTSSRAMSTLSFEEDVACELTTGDVVCGSVSRMLKHRQRNNDKTAPAHDVTKQLPQSKAEQTYDIALEDDSKMTAIIEELRVWKEQHKKRLQEIDASRAPQILKIDHDDCENVSLSDIDDDDDDDDDNVLCDDTVAFSDPMYHLEPLESLPQPASLPGIESADGVTRRPDTASEDAVLRKVKVRSAYTGGAAADSFDPSLPSPDTEAASQQATGQSASGLQATASDPLSAPPDFLRPGSGSVVGARNKFKLEPVVDKRQSKSIDLSRPVLRGPTSSPDHSKVLEAPRAGVSRASVGHVTVVDPVVTRSNPTARRQLANVPLLPSKFTK